MRKFLIIAIPIVFFALAIGVMLSARFFKKPIGKEEDITVLIDDMIIDINNEAWNEAEQELNKIDQTWSKVVFRVQFGSERDEINYLTTSIARLRGAVQAQDKTNALMELYEANSHWKRLGE